MGLFRIKSTSRRVKQCGKCAWFKPGTWVNCPGLGVCHQFPDKMRAKGAHHHDHVKIVFDHDIACSAYKKKTDD